MRESPIAIQTVSGHLLAIFSQPDVETEVGVLMLSGGDQCRTGSHRFFTELAWDLSQGGFASARFDWPGLGDSTGTALNFRELGTVLELVSSAFLQHCPNIKKLVLLGLCDGASVALLNATMFKSNLAGLCLLNPWVRTDDGLARAHIKHYYRARFLDPDFWRKLLSLKLNPFKVFLEFISKVCLVVMGTGRVRKMATFQDGMLAGLTGFNGRLLLVLSEKDLTAQEFNEYVQQDRAWSEAMSSVAVTRIFLEGADHTLSSRQSMCKFSNELLYWLKAHVE